MASKSGIRVGFITLSTAIILDMHGVLPYHGYQSNIYAILILQLLRFLAIFAVTFVSIHAARVIFNALYKAE